MSRSGDIDVYSESEYVYAETEKEMQEYEDQQGIVREALEGSEDWDEEAWEDFRDWLEEIGYEEAT